MGSWCLENDIWLLFSHLREEIALDNRIHVDLPRHVTLKFELVTDAHQLILLMLEDILDYVKEGFLAEMHESVQDFEGMLVWNDIGKETEEWIREKGL